MARRTLAASTTYPVGTHVSAAYRLSPQESAATAVVTVQALPLVDVDDNDYLWTGVIQVSANGITYRDESQFQAGVDEAVFNAELHDLPTRAYIRLRQEIKGAARTVLIQAEVT